jgi:hypothetical protein
MTAHALRRYAIVMEHFVAGRRSVVSFMTRRPLPPVGTEGALVFIDKEMS